MGIRRRATLRRWAMAAALLAVLVALHGWWLTLFARFLSVRMPVELRADQVLILGGDRNLEFAANRYHAGEVRHVVIPRFRQGRLEAIGILEPMHVVARRALNELGVPNQDILELPCDTEPAASTLERYREWLRKSPDRSALLLTSELSSRLTRWQVARYFPRDEAARIIVVPLVDRRFTTTNWWKSREGLKATFYYTFDLAYYCVRGPDPPIRLGERFDPDAYEASL